MELTPLRSAALGLLAMAALTLATALWPALARWLTRRLDLRPGLAGRCQGYTLALVAGGIGLAAVSEIVR